MMELALITVALLVVLGFGIYWTWQYCLRAKALKECISTLVEYNKDVQLTLRKGLVARFSKAADAETPWEFERFVARVIEGYCGGRAVATPATSDYGLDIRLERDGNLYLGHVQCCDEEKVMGFQVVATLHSQIVKHKAKGGFVVTTSSFSPKARSYAKGLNIDLVDGDRLVDMWLAVLQTKAVESNRLVAKHA